MLFFAFMSLCQVLFLPGFFVLRLLGIKPKGHLQALVYMFAFSLVSNYFMVMGLYALKLYSTKVLWLLLILEWLALFWCLRNSKIEFPGLSFAQFDWRCKLNHIALKLGYVLILASLFSFLLLGWRSFGSIFDLHDDIVSWDFWAVRWATQSGISHSSFYPQLLPCNWSIIYVLIENTDVKMFAKAIMTLFPIATIILFFDGFQKTAQRSWLYSGFFYAIILQYFFDQNFLASGYADVPCAFFAFLMFYAIVQLETGSTEDSFLNSLMPVVFASGAAATKQGGLYYLFWSLVWLISHLLRKNNSVNFIKQIGLSILLAVTLNSWYIYKLLLFWLKYDSDNLEQLLSLQMNRSFELRLIESFDMLRVARGLLSEPFFLVAMALVVASLWNKKSRMVAVTIVLPIYILWALFFSYSVRTLGLVLPFVAFCCGSGFETIQMATKRLFSWAIKDGTTPKRYEIFNSIVLLAVSAGVALLIYLQPVHAITIYMPPPEPETKWLKQLPSLWLWPLVFSAGAIVLSSRLRQQLRLKVPTTVVLALFCVVGCALLIGQNTVFSQQKLVEDQIAKRRLVVDPALNAELYKCQAERVIRGKIVTSYNPLGCLPGLEERYLWSPLLTRLPLKESDVEALRKDPDTDAMLVISSTIKPELASWLKTNRYKTLFEESGYTFVLFPRN